VINPLLRCLLKHPLPTYWRNRLVVAIPHFFDEVVWLIRHYDTVFVDLAVISETAKRDACKCPPLLTLTHLQPIAGGHRFPLGNLLQDGDLTPHLSVSPEFCLDCAGSGEDYLSISWSKPVNVIGKNLVYYGKAFYWSKKDLLRKEPPDLVLVLFNSHRMSSLLTSTGCHSQIPHSRTHGDELLMNLGTWARKVLCCTLTAP
jgi:hypothetical protein